MQDVQIDEKRQYRAALALRVAPEKDKLKPKVLLLATIFWKFPSHYFRSVVSNVASDSNVNGATASRAASPTRINSFAEGNVDS